MQNLKYLLLTFLLMIVCFLNALFAQTIHFSKHFDSKDSTQVHQINMRDGDIFKGRVRHIKGDSLIFVNQRAIIITVHHKEVKSIKVIGKDARFNRGKRSKRWEENRLQRLLDSPSEKLNSFFPQSMFLHATAFSPLPRGKRLYQNIDFYFNAWEYGLGKGFSVGIQIGPPLALNTNIRYSYSFTEKLHIGGSFNLINIFDPEVFFYEDFSVDGDLVFYPYGILTLGTPKIYLNVTAGIFIPSPREYAYLVEKKHFISTIGFGGQYGDFVYKGSIGILEVAYYEYNRVTNRYENDLHWTVAPSLAIGWRWRRSQLDIGFIALIDDIPLPYLSLKKLLR